MAVTVEDAIRKMIAAYWKGKEPEAMSKLGERKYTKKYFDGVSEEYGYDKEKELK